MLHLTSVSGPLATVQMLEIGDMTMECIFCMTMYRSILLRPWCYPYINPEIDSAPTHIMNSSIAKSTHTANRRAGFISVDKDVQYALDFQAPLIMRADNPGMKIMFVIRNPIERMIYHYLEFLKQFPNLVRATVAFVAWFVYLLFFRFSLSM